MRQLFINDEPTQYFFNEETSLEKLDEWVTTEIYDDNQVFQFNEAYSCNSSIIDDETIEISGDEDYRKLTFKKITPIC